MKKINKENEPNRLAVFRSSFPEAKWDKKKGTSELSFRCASERYIETQHALRTFQGNLCAYCEIDLLAGVNGKLDDCRIEHFHPKSQRAEGEKNWALDWDNLYVVCCGGNSREVAEGDSRFEGKRKNHSCDAIKKSKVLDDVILKPSLLPNTLIWSYNRSDGAITVNQSACNDLSIDVCKAQNTITELNLNVKRIRDGRVAVLNKVNDTIHNLMTTRNLNVEDARNYVAKALLKKNRAGDWPSYLSVIRHYLKSSAETVLESYGIDTI